MSSRQVDNRSLNHSPSKVRLSQFGNEIKKQAPSLHEFKRREEARLINMENVHIAKKLLSVRQSRGIDFKQ